MSVFTQFFTSLSLHWPQEAVTMLLFESTVLKFSLHHCNYFLCVQLTCLIQKVGIL